MNHISNLKFKIRLLAIAAIALTLLTTSSRALAERQDEIKLWPEGAPGALGTDAKDIPTLTPYIAPNAQPNGGTIVILPGGGYVNLAAHEGDGFAQFFMARGVTTFVLKYRLGNAGYHHPIELGDAARAIRWVRANAAKYNIDPAKVGIMGSSAGGHLASTLSTHFDAGDANAKDPIDKLSSRPDFAILCYPVITMGEKTHAGSKNALLGQNPSPELVAELSNELKVTDKTPPTFIWAGVNDRTVPIENTLMYAAALQKNNVPYELHVYENAPHGIGLGNRSAPFQFHPWTADLLNWLKLHKVVAAEVPNWTPEVAPPPPAPARGAGRGNRGPATAPAGAAR
jgi:acetyl esterase/lipase